MSQLNVNNRTLFISDNLPILEGMNSETVDLILIDPPFNSKRQFQGIGQASRAKFNDIWSWRKDVHPDWLSRMEEYHPTIEWVVKSSYHVSDPSMAAYISWMSIRLLELYRVLKPTGSMYLHCDPTASHYLKAMMDAVFGRENFRNEIVWRRTRGRSDAKRFGRVHDAILFYTKSDKFIWNTQYLPHDPEYVNRAYRNQDKLGRWRADNLTAPGHGRTEGEYFAEWRGVRPRSGRMWNVPMKGGMANWIVQHNIIPGWLEIEGVLQRLDTLDAAGLIHWPEQGDMPSLKRYLSSTRGAAAEDVIIDVGKLEARSKERTGWATQKPLALYSRLVRASSNEGDIVLDAFAGCATTCVAAEQLGRRWIGIDIDDEAENITADRLRRETRSFGEVDGSTADRPQLYIRHDPPFRTPDAPPPPTFKTPRRPKNIRMPPLSEARTYLACRDGTFCQGCGFQPPKGLLDFLEVDHKMPKSEGGTNEYDNLVLLCSPCNRRKAQFLTLAGIRRLNRQEDRMLGDYW